VRGRDVDALNDIMLTQLVHLVPKQAHDVARILQEVMAAAAPIPGTVAAVPIAPVIIYDVIRDIAPTLAERIYTYAEGDEQPLLARHGRRRGEVVARIQRYLENPGNHYAILHGNVDHFINDVFPTSVSRDISPSERRYYERLVRQIKIRACEERTRRVYEARAAVDPAVVRAGGADDVPPPARGEGRLGRVAGVAAGGLLAGVAVLIIGYNQLAQWRQYRRACQRQELRREWINNWSLAH
jgi:hypothetical protein